jgi:tetratricopeptide (TPR) repeat protein
VSSNYPTASERKASIVRSTNIHRVVQEVLKDELDKDQRREWAERAVRAVNSAFPSPEFPNWPDCERLLPHAKACAAIIEEFSFEFEHAARLLNKTAFYIDDRAQYVEAEPLYQRALAIREKALGPEHLSVATILNNLAVLYRTQGRYKEAEPLYQRALAIRERALGPEHPDMAQSLNNLALVYEDQGRREEAEPRLQRALAICEKALGLDHPNVATVLENCAGLLREMGCEAEAAKL